MAGIKRVHFIDLETHAFGPHRMCPPIVCMSWQTRGDAEPSLALWHDARRRLREMLLEAIEGRAIIAGHRISYDMACVIANDEELAPLVWRAYAADGIECTRVREKLLDIRDGNMLRAKNKNDRPYSLNQICGRHFDARLDKGDDGWRTRYDELDGVPLSQWPKRAVDYATDDSGWGLRLYDHQARRMVASSYDCPTQHLDARAAFGLQLTSAWGVTTDRERALVLQTDINRRMGELEKRLVKAGLMRLKNPTLSLFAGAHSPTTKDMRAIRAAVEATWPPGLGKVPLTKGQSISTSKDTMEMCGHPALKALIEYNALQKQGSTYVEALLAEVIHAFFNELVASGRTSCRGPNLQNQPRLPGVRECFVARPGRVLVACDYNSQEMRTLAQAQLNLVGRSKLAERYQRDPNFDPHQDFADATGGERQHAKIANFGIPGGMGVTGLIRFAKGSNQDWSPEFASDIRKKYFVQWPEMNGFFSYVRSVVGPGSCGNLVIPQSGMVMGAVGYTDASNRLFQTPAAHASKSALFEIARRCFDRSLDSPLLASRPWNFVHDEIIVEAPDFAVDDVAAEMERVMVEAMEPWVPDVPCTAEATAMLRWSKKAKHTTDANGRIVPWDEPRRAA